MKYLTDLEQKAIRLLADDKSYNLVKRDCGLSTLQLCAFMAAIRRKTGILDTKDAPQVRDYLTRYESAMAGPGPSALQKQIINRVLGVDHPEHTLEAVDNNMQLPHGTAAREYEAGLNAAGIYATAPSDQKVQARIYMASTHPRPAASMLNEKHVRALRLYAQGMSNGSIAEQMPDGFNTEAAVAGLIEDGIARLGVTSRGRGVQRRLVAIALDRLEAEKAADALNDPMF